jgi:ribonuclease HI
MFFRDQLVYVHVDGQGRPILDGEGRAEMKYREADTKVYRPAPGNLGKVPAGYEAKAGPAAGARPAAKAGKKLPKKPPGPAAPDTQHVWTDGACTGNPGPMGLGVLVIWNGQRKELSEYLGLGTNNIAELTAIERGLAIAEGAAPERNRPVRIYTDSAYSIGVLSQGWKAKANQELVARIRAQLGRFADVTFVKVAGHAGIPENERCDELARRAIETRGR